MLYVPNSTKSWTLTTALSTWTAIRANHFTVTNLLVLVLRLNLKIFVQQSHPRCIIDFIKEIEFHGRIWSSSFHAYRFYVCTIFIYCAYPVSKVSHFTYNVLSFLYFTIYYNELFLDRFYLDRFLALTASLCWCAVKHHANKQSALPFPQNFVLTSQHQ